MKQKNNKKLKNYLKVKSIKKPTNSHIEKKIRNYFKDLVEIMKTLKDEDNYIKDNYIDNLIKNKDYSDGCFVSKISMDKSKKTKP